jgi:hypothetical protein
MALLHDDLRQANVKAGSYHDGREEHGESRRKAQEAAQEEALAEGGHGDASAHREDEPKAASSRESMARREAKAAKAAKKNQEAGEGWCAGVGGVQVGSGVQVWVVCRCGWCAGVGGSLANSVAHFQFSVS